MKLWPFVLLWLLLLARSVSAQPAPLVATTLQTTSTATSSLVVGCPLGSGTCIGGIISGPISASLISLSSGYVEIQPFLPGSCTNRIVNNAGTLQWNCSTLAVGGSISGATNTIPVFTASNAIGNSIMTQSGTTITVATTLNAINLGGLLTTANQTGLTGTGTITSGTWNATKIGLAYGGTNNDLSGTGGPSQYLRQNALGAAVTVQRPAVADLSDSANVALLNAVNTFATNNIFSTFIQFPTNYAGGYPSGSIFKHSSDGLVLTETTGSNFDFVLCNIACVAGIMLVPTGTTNVNFNGIVTSGAGYTLTAGNILLYGGVTIYNASGDIYERAGTGGALRLGSGNTNDRWGINSLGDFTFGGSLHIADASGTPSIGSGFGGGTIVGTDYALIVTQGGTVSTSGVVNFGHTWTNPPVCVLSWNVGAASALAVTSTTTTQLSISNTSTNNQLIYVLCRGY